MFSRGSFDGSKEVENGSNRQLSNDNENINDNLSYDDND